MLRKRREKRRFGSFRRSWENEKKEEGRRRRQGRKRKAITERREKRNERGKQTSETGRHEISSSLPLHRRGRRDDATRRNTKTKDDKKITTEHDLK